MENYDISAYAQSDSFYLKQVGDFVRASRIAQQQTQEELSTAAGINRSTLIQLEKGESVTLISLIQVLRALKQLQLFQNFVVQPKLSPLKLAAAEQRQSKRVRKSKTSKDHPQSNW